MLESGGGGAVRRESGGVHPIQVQRNNAPIMSGKATSVLSLFRRNRFDLYSFTALPPSRLQILPIPEIAVCPNLADYCRH